MNLEEFECILPDICATFGITVAELVGSSRKARILKPRQIMMFIAREVTGAPFQKIGKLFKRDHSTINSGVSRVKCAYASDGEHAKSEALDIWFRHFNIETPEPPKPKTIKIQPVSAKIGAESPINKATLMVRFSTSLTDMQIANLAHVDLSTVQQIRAEARV